MTRDAALADDDMGQPVFEATIRPNRSLGRVGFRVMMVLLGLVVALASLRLIALGVWPVSGFLLLDVVGLYVAFRVSYARGRSFEEIVLTPIELLFRRVTHRGVAREWRMNPLWTKLVRETHEEFGLQRLALVSRGERVVIAGELSPGEREHLADEFGRALAAVKRGD
jgi:uncharacterized membrane protein